MKINRRAALASVLALPSAVTLPITAARAGGLARPGADAMSALDELIADYQIKEAEWLMLAEAHEAQFSASADKVRGLKGPAYKKAWRDLGLADAERMAEAAAHAHKEALEAIFLHRPGSLDEMDRKNRFIADRLQRELDLTEAQLAMIFGCGDQQPGLSAGRGDAALARVRLAAVNLQAAMEAVHGECGVHVDHDVGLVAVTKAFGRDA